MGPMTEPVSIKEDTRSGNRGEPAGAIHIGPRFYSSSSHPGELWHGTVTPSSHTIGDGEGILKGRWKRGYTVQPEQSAVTLEMLEFLSCWERSARALFDKGAQSGIAKEERTIWLSCGNTNALTSSSKRNGTKSIGLKTHTTHPCRKARRLSGGGEGTHSPHPRVTTDFGKRLTI